MMNLTAADGTRGSLLNLGAMTFATYDTKEGIFVLKAVI
jgi:hypothetical protein